MKNKDAAKVDMKEYYENNKNPIKLSQNEYYEQNKDAKKRVGISGMKKINEVDVFQYTSPFLLIGQLVQLGSELRKINKYTNAYINTQYINQYIHK